MYRGTTPTIKIKVNTSLDLDNMKEIWVTLKSLKIEKTYAKSNNEITIVKENDESFIHLLLSQKDTLDFMNGKARIQIRLLDFHDIAYASNIQEVNINEILKDGEIL